MIKKIPIGISSCLLGQNVRYDGGKKLDNYITGTLSAYFDFQPFRPEVSIGLGTPRPPIHLVKNDNGLRCVNIKNPEIDLTDQLRSYAEHQQNLYVSLCGYILKKSSPSCGMEMVKVFSGTQSQKNGVGIYAEEMMRLNPLLPVEEGRLGDPGLRENFIQRVYVFYRWKTMLSEGLTVSGLTNFHAHHKLIIMSHGEYRSLGQLIAEITKADLTKVADKYIFQQMTMLKKPVNRKNHVNVLQHIQGYLKQALSADDKAELCEVIERY